MNGYSVEEAAEVLGIPQGRVWELIARGVLAGATEGGGSMRVYLKAAPPATVADDTEAEGGANGNGHHGNGESRVELSPFRELLTEFRNLTERYGQALLALGEARGEVASLRSRVDLLEARMDMRLPVRAASTAAWELPDRQPQPAAAPAAPSRPAEAPSRPAEAPPEPAEAPPSVDATAAGQPDEPETVEVPPATPLPAADQASEELEQPASAAEARPRRSGSRIAIANLAEALARAEDPTLAALPGAHEAGAALAALQRQVEASDVEPQPRPDTESEPPDGVMTEPEPASVEQEPVSELDALAAAAPSIELAEETELESALVVEEEPEPIATVESVPMAETLADEGATEIPEEATPEIPAAAAEEPVPEMAEAALTAEPGAEVERLAAEDVEAEVAQAGADEEPTESEAEAEEVEPRVAQAVAQDSAPDTGEPEMQPDEAHAAIADPEPAATETETVESPYSTEVIEPDWFADGDFTWLDAPTEEPAQQDQGQAEAEAAQEPAEPAAQPLDGDATEAEHLVSHDELPVAEEIQEAFEEPPRTEAISIGVDESHPGGGGGGAPPTEARISGFGLFRGQPEAPSVRAAIQSGPATAVRDEEALMWLGDEFEAGDLEVAAPGWRGEDSRREARPAPAPALQLSDAEIEQLASSEGWDQEEVDAIRGLLGRAPSPAPAEEASEPGVDGGKERAIRVEPPVTRPRIARSADHEQSPDWLHNRRGPAANAYRRLRRLFEG